MVDIIFLFLLFACWGSFLNVVAYRVTYDKPFFTKRSYCPSCNKVIAWYDNIPIVSWILLKGRCRSCAGIISVLYPLIELLSGVIFTLVFFMFYTGVFDLHFIGSFSAYFIFFSALLVATRTDLQEMIIPQMVSLWLIPVGILFSFAGVTYVFPVDSVLGAVFGYGVLWLIGKVFWFLKKKEGIGIGDMELLGMIGSFLGLLGVWLTVLIGSVSALLIGGGYLYFSGKGRHAKMPFGPFLVIGATIYFFFRDYLLTLLIK